MLSVKWPHKINSNEPKYICRVVEYVITLNYDVKLAALWKFLIKEKMVIF